MSMHEPPLPVYPLVNAGHPNTEFGQRIAAADSGPVMLHFDHARKIVVRVLRYKVDTNDRSIAILSGCACKSLCHLGTATGKRAKGIAQRYIVSVGKQRFIQLGVSIQDRTQCPMTLFDCGVEACRRRHRPCFNCKLLLSYETDGKCSFSQTYPQ